MPVSDSNNSSPTQTARQMRRAGVIAVLAFMLLLALSATVWAAWGAPWRNGLVAALRAGATATPTRTPRPATAAPPRGAAEPSIIPFTATPQPTPTAIPPTPTPEITAEPLPADLAAVAARYGIDPKRRFVVVDEKTQQMTIWDPAAGPAMGGQTLRRLPVSTGDESHGYRTPAWYGLIGAYWGTFHSAGVYADEGWYLHEDNGANLIHGAPYTLVDGQKVYEELDAIGSYPASHGCIRLRPEDARWFTEWQPQGVPLVILSNGE